MVFLWNGRVGKLWTELRSAQRGFQAGNYAFHVYYTSTRNKWAIKYESGPSIRLTKGREVIHHGENVAAGRLQRSTVCGIAARRSEGGSA
jgi:hypothetical protein